MNYRVYRKLIAYGVGAVAVYFGSEYIPAPEALTEGVILLLTGVGVWGARNDAPNRHAPPR